MEARELNNPFSAPMSLEDCLELQRQLPDHRFGF
jgi:hypothetical protein